MSFLGTPAAISLAASGGSITLGSSIQKTAVVNPSTPLHPPPYEAPAPVAVDASAAVLSSLNAAYLSEPAASLTAPVKLMSYKELEETVERWLSELSKQENEFLNQALHINNWDKQLIENSERVTEINHEVERVKTDQMRLDRELDFILAQQEELQDLLLPIETKIKSQERIEEVNQYDAEREKAYNSADNVGNQLKNMMGDLKEIIERINLTNVDPNQGREGDTITQISKILNSHMDSLQWIDQNTQQLQTSVDDVSHIMEKQKYD